MGKSRKKIAVSACLAGIKCRYDGSDNADTEVLRAIEENEAVLFCPEDHCYGTPRPTMDLYPDGRGGIAALRENNMADMTPCILKYVDNFFKKHPDIDLFIGKDRSPSCAVSSARLYGDDGELISSTEDGIMTAEARRRGIECTGESGFRAL